MEKAICCASNLSGKIPLAECLSQKSASSTAAAASWASRENCFPNKNSRFLLRARCFPAMRNNSVLSFQETVLIVSQVVNLSNEKAFWPLFSVETTELLDKRSVNKNQLVEKINAFWALFPLKKEKVLQDIQQ